VNTTRARARTLVPALCAAATLAATLTACGSSDAGTASGDTLRVGVFFPGSVSDTGFMESGYLGYQRLEETLGDRVELSYVEQVAARVAAAHSAGTRVRARAERVVFTRWTP